jgi:hypothetical protein
MAFSISALQLMADTIFKNANCTKEKSCCILGFPNISKTEIKVLENIFNRKIDECSFHGILRSHGYTDIKVLDFSDYQGAEIIHNLNNPLPDDIQKFDLVIDNGTNEHCFNVGQAMLNTAHLCSKDGQVFHLNPANWFGHGFWNFNPCTYFDFYRENGFDVKVYLRDIPAGLYTEILYQPLVTKILPSKRYTTHAVAVRKELKELKYPMQSRYT